MNESDNEKQWQSHWASLGLGNLSVRATNIIAFIGNKLDNREAIIEAVKSRRLLKCPNCGFQTYNEIATAIGLKNYHVRRGEVHRILRCLRPKTVGGFQSR
jgi:hypothetical protein